MTRNEILKICQESINLDLTNAINKLCDGKANETEQEVCGLVLKNLISKKGVKPNINKDDRPYCPNCDHPVCTNRCKFKEVFGEEWLKRLDNVIKNTTSRGVANALSSFLTEEYKEGDKE